MSMSRKDYQAIADAIYRSRLYMTETECQAIDHTTSYISAALAQDNPRFDADKFKAACHYRNGKGEE